MNAGSGRLNGKVAIITGAGSGMGRATAKLFHAQGARVVLGDISGVQMEVARELGDGAVALHADVSAAADAKAMVDLAISRFGKLDTLCNIAGAPGELCALAEDSEAHFDFMVNVNLRGVFLTMKHAIPHMLENGGGSIVNVSSTAAIIGTPGLGVYGASKGGVLPLTRTAALEHAAQGIRVNTICPGMIDTPMLRHAEGTDTALVDAMADVLPMKRFGRPEEIAAAVLFLASDEASYITGVTLPVDGGMVVD